MTAAVRNWVLAFACCVGLVVLCVIYADRPVANFAHRHLFRTPLFAVATGVFRPLQIVTAAGLLIVAGSGLGILVRRRAVDRLRVPLECAAAATFALPIALLLKFAIGRSQVYPVYLADHIYEFRPFHGGTNYEAFPSATMTVTLAIVGVVWDRLPRLRTACVSFTALLAAALVVTNGHWLGDIAAGTFLGALLGWSVSQWSGRVVRNQ
jgi:membrane-associated phospholipid phosphatase